MKKEKEAQIVFPIDVKPDNTVTVFKRTFNKKVVTAGVIPYFRSFSFVSSLLITFLTLGFLSIILYQSYVKFPSEIPLIYSQSLGGWDVVGKENMLIFLGLFALFTILSPFINSKIYSFDKRLVLVLSLGTIIVDCLILIAFSEIFSLILH